MKAIDFGCVGVDVTSYTSNDLANLFKINGLNAFIANSSFYVSDQDYSEGSYLQTDCAGPICETTSVCVLRGYIRCVTDMETYLLILRTAVLDIEAANVLINDLYREGLIKPRKVL